MIKKSKIIATLGPAIYSEDKLKRIIKSGVDAFRINFSHNVAGIQKIVTKIRKIEKQLNRRLSIIGDLQGVKLRIGNINADSIDIKNNQKFIFDINKKIGDQNRVCFPYPLILKKLKIGNKILIDDGKFTFKIIKKIKKGILTVCQSSGCKIRSNKSVHLQNFFMRFNKLTTKDKADINFNISCCGNNMCANYKLARR